MLGLLKNLINSGYDIIFFEKSEIHGIGIAINDRLLRSQPSSETNKVSKHSGLAKTENKY